MARLSCGKPRIASSSAAIAKPPPKTVEPYYRTTEWQNLRKACLERANYRCEIALPGCTHHATIADHITSRRNGGADTLANLRAACASCDSRVKEDHLGRRRGQA